VILLWVVGRFAPLLPLEEELAGSPAFTDHEAPCAGFSEDHFSSEVSSSSSSSSENPYALSIGGITDPGVHGKQNQDDFFVEKLPGDNCILGVFDGHGRELGQLAAKTAKEFIRDQLRREDVRAEIEKDPKGTFVELFDKAHKAIEAVSAVRCALIGRPCDSRCVTGVHNVLPGGRVAGAPRSQRVPHEAAWGGDPRHVRAWGHNSNGGRNLPGPARRRGQRW
jgi:hypothetical protein